MTIEKKPWLEIENIKSITKSVTNIDNSGVATFHKSVTKIEIIWSLNR
jgi:hypothetical protein